MHKTYIFTNPGMYFLFVKMPAGRSAPCYTTKHKGLYRLHSESWQQRRITVSAPAEGHWGWGGALGQASTFSPIHGGSKPAAGHRLGSHAADAPKKICCQDHVFCLFAKEYTWSKISGLICLNIFVMDYAMSVFSRSVTYYACIWARQRNAFTNVCLMWMHLNCYSKNEYFLLLNTFYSMQFEN